MELETHYSSKRRSFHTLDGLRGVAAIFIVGRHLPALFGGIAFPESFLAVDLFFALSGYVIAYAYDAKLSKGAYVRTFMSLRLIRLYPLYLLALAIGVMNVIFTTSRHGHDWTISRFITEVGCSLLFLPTSAPDGALVLPFNGPTWSLLIELIANFAFAALYRHLTRSRLLVIAGLGAVAMILAVVCNGTLDARSARIFVGLTRVAFSFPIGVLIFRSGVRHARRPAQSLIALSILAVLLGVHPLSSLRPAYELLAVLIAFPLLVTWASRIEPAGSAYGGVFASLGLGSYAVYVLHQPAGELLLALCRHGLHVDLAQFAPWSGFIYLIILFGACLLIDRLYDQPARAWLRKKLVRTA